MLDLIAEPRAPLLFRAIGDQRVDHVVPGLQDRLAMAI